jgi:hypothetical protein
MSQTDEWAVNLLKSIDLTLSLEQIVEQDFTHLHSGVFTLSVGVARF